MAEKSKKKPALGEEKGIFRQRKRHIWVLYLSVKKKKELNFPCILTKLRTFMGLFNETYGRIEEK